MIGIVGDRFERRLTEETSKLRIEMAALRSDLRQEMTEGSTLLRREMTQGFSSLRREMTAGFASLRQEMAESSASLRQALADQRFEILVWVFLFWVGQFFAVASLAAVLIRFLRPAG